MNAAASGAARISARGARGRPRAGARRAGDGDEAPAPVRRGFRGGRRDRRVQRAAERRGDGQRGVRARDARGRDQTLGVDILEGPIERTVVERVESVAADGVGSRLDAVVILKRGKLEVEPNLRRERRRRRADHRLQPLVQRVARGAGGERRVRSVRRGPAAHAPDPARRPGGALGDSRRPRPERATRRAAVEVRRELRERRPRSERRGRAPARHLVRDGDDPKRHDRRRGRVREPPPEGAPHLQRARGAAPVSSASLWTCLRLAGPSPSRPTALSTCVRSSRPARSGPPRPGSRGCAPSG